MKEIYLDKETNKYSISGLSKEEMHIIRDCMSIVNNTTKDDNLFSLLAIFSTLFKSIKPYN